MDFPYGEIESSVPTDYYPPDMWPEFGSVASPQAICSREEVGLRPKGVRWGLWPIYFEEYVGDLEPDLTLSNQGQLTYSRWVVWNRLRQSPLSAGWTVISKRPWRIDGYVDLKENSDFTSTWGRKVRRELKLWHNQHAAEHRIEKISLDEYRSGYKHSSTKKKIGMDQFKKLERQLTLSQVKDHATLWGVRNLQTNKIIAGLVAFDSPTFRSSAYGRPFVTNEGKKVFAMAALIEQWFLTSRSKGFNRLYFTYFWHRGEPKSWKGFSLYKSRFGLKYVAYPPTLWKFVRGKFF